MDNRYTLQTVERAIAFLEYVATSPSPPTIRDVSADLELNITTCYHLLRTFIAQGYIVRLPDNRLELGDRISVLVGGFRKNQDREQYLAGVVQQLAATTLETSFLSLREGDSVVLKVLIEGTQRLRVAGLYVGLKGQEFRRASGKAVLAHLDDKARQAMLEAGMAGLPERQRKSIFKALEKELPLVVSQGWAVDDGQTEHGIIAVSAPIFAVSGEVVGATGIVTPTFRMDKSRDAFINSVSSAAAEATRLVKSMGTV